MRPELYIDFYKVGHVEQYQPGIQQIWSNWTARGSRIDDINHTINFGLQSFIKNYLIEEFQENFFEWPKSEVVSFYQDLIKNTLGIQEPKTDHIEWLHDLGYLPLKIYGLQEGLKVPLKIPTVIITNTLPEAYWLPNYIESIFSNRMWKATTSATIAQSYRELFIRYARMAGETDFSFVDWQGHDFSFRGMSGIEDAVLSGMGHLLSFKGTDTIPAILAAQRYYDASLDCGGSVPATEHSVMSAGSKEGELDTFRRLITEVYPSGIVSIVSDTWDLWKVLTEYIPALKSEIENREGKVVIRPDSGDPIKIICGDSEKEGNEYHPYKTNNHPAVWGVATLLEMVMGTEGPMNRRMLNKVGMIYGDSITRERAKAILQGLLKKGLSPYNMVFGIGSFTYEYVTRDTFGFAMKATAARFGGEVIPIYKNPVTDSGEKKSVVGIPIVNYARGGNLVMVDNGTPEQLDNCAFDVVFEDGNLLKDETFETIRQRVRNYDPV